MEYLKKYITSNIFVLSGYYYMLFFINIFLSQSDGGGFILAIYPFIYFLVRIPIQIILLLFCVEILIMFIIKKFSGKDFRLKINNKFYNIYFRIGILFFLFPLIFALDLPVDSLFFHLNPNSEFARNFIILIILDIFIQLIFPTTRRCKKQ